jgi:hypothetical protein
MIQYHAASGYKQARKEARARATALGHTVSPFVIYLSKDPGRHFGADCGRCHRSMIHSEARGIIEGNMLLDPCR